MSLLSIRDLTLRFKTDEGLITAIDDVSFDVAPGEVLGIVGESGSGKSVTAKSIMRLNARNAEVDPRARMHLTVEGTTHDILALRSANDLKLVRGGAVSMIFQEPMASFAPAIKIGRQMTEMIQLHLGGSERDARERAIAMLDRVGISDAARRFDQYAFELSGGMRQRAMIATALLTHPKLLIADEPTTALDVTIQAQVLDLFRELVTDTGMGVIFITHDLGVVAQICDRMAVMYLGRVVETGPTRDVVRRPEHPYTRGLLDAIPRLDDLDAPLRPVPGDIPSPLERPSGCVFHTRCPVRLAGTCEGAVPELTARAGDHTAACFVTAPAAANHDARSEETVA